MVLLFNIEKIHKYKGGIETYMELHHVKKMLPLLFINLLVCYRKAAYLHKENSEWRKVLQSKGAVALFSNLFYILGAVGSFMLNYLWTYYRDAEVKVFCAHLGT